MHTSTTGCFEPTVGDKRAQDSTDLVVIRSKYSEGDTLNTTDTTSNYSDRCIVGGMGSPHAITMLVRDLVRIPSNQAHQLARVESSAVSPERFQRRHSGKDCISPDGQYYSSSLPQQRGGDSLTGALFSDKRHSSLVHPVQDPSASQAHSGSKERSAGCIVPEGQDFSDRMDITPSDSEHDIRPSRQTTCGSVCHKSEPPTTSVCVAGSRRSSLGSGCIEHTLGRHPRLCLPTSSPDPKGPQQDPGGRLCDHSNRSVVATTSVVQRNIRSPDRVSDQTARQAGPSLSTTQFPPSQGPVSPKINCMEIIKNNWIERGIPEDSAERAAQARRLSTRNTYDARIRIFSDWCKLHHVRPLQTSLGQVASFLTYLFKDRELGVRTIAGYRAAISAIHPGWDNTPVGKHQLLADMIKAFTNERPPARQICPSWNLPLVLMKLSLPPFEPLDKAEMKWVTWKTVFLIAAASARRRSTLHALSVEPGHIAWSGEGVNLIPSPGFMAKNESMSYMSKAIFLPKMAVVSDIHEDTWLCPCRALKIYLERSKESRGEHKQLFLTYAKGKARPCSRDSVSRWVTDTIKHAYSNATLKERLKCKAHDVRGLSSSWALVKGVPLENIMQAANWKSDSTFSAFYMRDVSGQSSQFARAVLSSSQPDHL